MSINRRKALLGGATALAVPPMPVFAQGKELYVAGATYNLRDPIVNEFQKRTGVTIKPWINPSAQARVDRIRTAPVDTLETDTAFMKYAWDEKLVVPIDTKRLPNWSKLDPLLREGRAAPDLAYGFGDNPGAHHVRRRCAHARSSSCRTCISLIRSATIPRRCPSRTTPCPGANCSIPKWRGKVSIYGIDWLGMLDAALGMQALGLIKPADVCQPDRKRSRRGGRLPQGKEEGRAFPRVVEGVRRTGQPDGIGRGVDRRCVVADGDRGPCQGRALQVRRGQGGLPTWAVGSCISHTCKNRDLAYEWLNFWLEGYAGAEQSKLGFFSPVDTYQKYLTPQQVHDWYGGGAREGGAISERTRHVLAWNTRPTNQDYSTEKWNEFLAA